MRIIPDLFGKLCKQYFDIGKSHELKLQFDNGTIIQDFPVDFYVNTEGIRPLEMKFLAAAKGKVLDIGCGSGRIGVYLKEKGFDVIGTDISKNLIYIAQKRGLATYQMDVNKELPKDIFDTVLMYGNGFGLPGSIENIQNLLLRLHNITNNQSILIAESNDPHRMKDNLDLDYQNRNKKLGRYIGQRRWRILSNDQVEIYQDWVQLEPRLLQEISEKTGWKMSSTPMYERGSRWGSYFFILSRK